MLRRSVHAVAALAVATAGSLAAASPAAALDCDSANYPSQTKTYVCSLYEDDAILHRAAASPREVNYWTDAIGRFGRVRTVEAFVYSVEYMVEVAGDGYLQPLGREPDPAGLAYWTDRLRSGALTPETYVLGLANSTEHAAHFGNDPGRIVDFWYDYILLRAAEPAGRAFWVDRLEDGMLRSDLVSSLQNLPEGTTRTIRTVYGLVLEREPTAAEVNGWTGFLRQNGRARLLVQIAASQEAFDTAS